MNHYFWTSFGYRLSLLKTQNTIAMHWLFLPGGPGLGSEYLRGLAVNLDLPGLTWLVDFPGDGSNRIDRTMSPKVWVQGLIDLVASLQPCVLVAHSFGGMFALTIPELEPYLSGLILLNSAPNDKWKDQFENKEEIASYYLNPNSHKIIERHIIDDEDLKKVTLKSAHLFFTDEEMNKGKTMLKDLPYNATYFNWAESKFHSNYFYKWVPNKIPTMIIGSEQDKLCPINLFYQEKVFSRDNIRFHSLSNTGHFPWIEKQNEINTIFRDFIMEQLKISSFT